MPDLVVSIRMVASGEVHARINERDGMVTFLEDPEQFCSAVMAQRLDAAIKQSQGLAEKVQVRDGWCREKVGWGKGSRDLSASLSGGRELDGGGGGGGVYRVTAELDAAIKQSQELVQKLQPGVWRARLGAGKDAGSTTLRLGGVGDEMQVGGGSGSTVVLGVRMEYGGEGAWGTVTYEDAAAALKQIKVVE